MTYENERGTRWTVRPMAGYSHFGIMRIPKGRRKGFFNWNPALCKKDKAAAEAALTAMAKKNGWTLVPDKEE